MKRIKSETYKVGEKIPTEYELCKLFNVSRTTVRTALNHLTIEGYLERLQGKGTYVSNQKVQQTLTQTVKRYRDQIAIQGKEAKIILIQIEVIPADHMIQQSLESEMDAPIQRIERVRFADGEPTQYEISYIPWKIAPGITKKQAETSLYGTLTEVYNVPIKHTTEYVDITLADDIICQYLQCESGTPCFYIETIAKDEHNRIIEFSRSYFRSDKTSFVIEREYPSHQ